MKLPFSVSQLFPLTISNSEMTSFKKAFITWILLSEWCFIGSVCLFYLLSVFMVHLSSGKVVSVVCSAFLSVSVFFYWSRPFFTSVLSLLSLEWYFILFVSIVLCRLVKFFRDKSSLARCRSAFLLYYLKNLFITPASYHVILQKWWFWLSVCLSFLKVVSYNGAVSYTPILFY